MGINPQPNAFTQEEKEAIIEAFESHHGNWNGRGYTGFAYSYYAELIKFWFLTGCRPSEGIGLTWGQINDDCSQIIFNQSRVQLGNGKIVKSEGSKNSSSVQDKKSREGLPKVTGKGFHRKLPDNHRNPMNQINLLRDTLKPYLGWHGARLNFLALFLIALLRVKTINLVELAAGFRSQARMESSYKRCFFAFFGTLI